ncbi:MAG: hypothetical protein LUF25_05285 [Phascolarctobacterium sp.]|nr:hypothetical protein [Phascolarctobacterium sp.]
MPGQLSEEENSICVSALKNINLDKLKGIIAENLKIQAVEDYFLIPYSDSEKVSRIHNVGVILEQEYLPEGTMLKVRLKSGQVVEFKKYIKKR